jgi:hypothetical protein
MTAALALATVAPEMVAIEARRFAGEHLAPVIPIGAPHCEARPAPDLSAYDELLHRKEAGR